MNQQTTGSCNCGGVTFKVNKNDIKRVVNCHCNLCRKMNGTAFSTYVVVLEDGFTLITGQTNIRTHKVTENATKSFCSLCGTPIYNTNPKYPGFKILYLGSFNDAAVYKPEVNIYCESKVDWLQDILNITSFEQAVLRS